MSLTSICHSWCPPQFTWLRTLTGKTKALDEIRRVLSPNFSSEVRWLKQRKRQALWSFCSVIFTENLSFILEQQNQEELQEIISSKFLIFPGRSNPVIMGKTCTESHSGVQRWSPSFLLHSSRFSYHSKLPLVGSTYFVYISTPIWNLYFCTYWI